MKSQMLLLVAMVSVSGAFAGCDKKEATTLTVTSVTPAPSGDVTTTKPDNTAMNKVDRDNATLTPMNQSENAGDIKITADIRRAVLDDNNLSTDAHNVKIITNKGAVTLRGVVDNASERDSIDSKAKAVAGVTGVDNELQLKNP